MSPAKSSSTSDERFDEPTLEGAFSDDGVDLTLIRWMLRLTPAQRLQTAQSLVNATSALRRGASDRAQRANDP
jgi:hypothetical protein